MHVFLTGYDSMLAVTLITIVGAMMVHVFCPGGCLRTNAMARFAGFPLSPAPNHPIGMAGSQKRESRTGRER